LRAALAAAHEQRDAWRSLVILERFPDTNNPGYFLIKLAVAVMAVLAALQEADVALIPVVPSPADLWSTKGIERLVLQVQAGRKGLRAALVPNRVARTNLAWDVLEVMRDFSLPVLGAALSQRNAYAQSAVLGASVHQIGRAGSEAAREVNRLVVEVLKLTGEKV
ncbi:MAG: hypothetical protein LCH90_15940, partial [Proteobacteria bacterium]|nr:hypothetical protein [Pseudomonadota bacterium]